MPSALTWLDNSESDRRKALDVVDLFALREARDELGIGSVRDALADILSPGTSTIQTRARYFFFVPWLYHQLGRGGRPRSLAEHMRRRETQLAEELSLRERHDVIGKRAKEHVKRLPSEIYWAGLGVLGIRRFRGSQSEYHRELLRATTLMEPDPEMEREVPTDAAWDPHLPPPSSEFPKGASFSLTPVEADYLLDRIRYCSPQSLLQLLSGSAEPWVDAALPWEHPDTVRAPRTLRTQLEHARCFSEMLHGAALLYNLMLCKLAGKSDWQAVHSQSFAGWAIRMEQRRAAHREWSLPDFWILVEGQRGQVHPTARRFIDQWISIVRGTDPSLLIESEPALALVRNRETSLKGRRSRFTSRSHLDQWSGASATSPLDFRWRITKAVASDIRAGRTNSMQ